MLVKNGHVHLAPRAHDLPMVSHMRAKITVQFSFLYWWVFFKKSDGSFFCGNSGGVGRPYLLVAPIFKGLLELMAIIPHFNGSTTWLTSLLLSRYSFSRKDKGHIWYKQALPLLLLPSPSLFLLLLFLVCR